MFLGRLLYTAIPHGRHGTGSGSPYATLHYAVWCIGARGVVFRDDGGQRTARGVCGAVFVTPVLDGLVLVIIFVQGNFMLAGITITILAANSNHCWLPKHYLSCTSVIFEATGFQLPMQIYALQWSIHRHSSNQDSLT